MAVRGGFLAVAEFFPGRLVFLHLGLFALRPRVWSDPAGAEFGGEASCLWPECGNDCWDRILDVDQLELGVEEADLVRPAFFRPFDGLAAQQRLHDFHVGLEPRLRHRRKAKGAAAGIAGGSAEDHAPGASALMVARPEAVTGAMRFDGMTTPVHSLIFDVTIAEAPIAANISALSNCVS